MDYNDLSKIFIEAFSFNIDLDYAKVTCEDMSNSISLVLQACNSSDTMNCISLRDMISKSSLVGDALQYKDFFEELVSYDTMSDVTLRSKLPMWLYMYRHLLVNLCQVYLPKSLCILVVPKSYYNPKDLVIRNAIKYQQLVIKLLGMNNTLYPNQIVIMLLKLRDALLKVLCYNARLSVYKQTQLLFEFDTDCLVSRVLQIGVIDTDTYKCIYNTGLESNIIELVSSVNSLWRDIWTRKPTRFVYNIVNYKDNNKSCDKEYSIYDYVHNCRIPFIMLDENLISSLSD